MYIPCWETWLSRAFSANNLAFFPAGMSVYWPSRIPSPVSVISQKSKNETPLSPLNGVPLMILLYLDSDSDAEEQDIVSTNPPHSEGRSPLHKVGIFLAILIGYRTKKAKISFWKRTTKFQLHGNLSRIPLAGGDQKDCRISVFVVVIVCLIVWLFDCDCLVNN